MPRSISFALTIEQFLDGSKDVTRRMGWATLGPDDVLCAVKKAMGLRKGERIERLGLIRILGVRREALNLMILVPKYGRTECIREGFPDWSPERFVEFFCASHSCKPSDHVTRIEFERMPVTPPHIEQWGGDDSICPQSLKS